MQERRLDVAKSAEGQHLLTSSLTAALEALSRVDMYNAAKGVEYSDRITPVKDAMDSRHHSVSPVLNLTSAEIRYLGEALPTALHASFSGAACAPVIMTCHEVESLHPERVSILFQVRASHPTCNQVPWGGPRGTPACAFVVGLCTGATCPTCALH